ncbi:MULTISPECIES: SA1362 family protein [unclassified Cytobacillus]|uniref:SA1362 family protein n=1 Tax=unclassified Cytobacillus TaxID=2675268 RepID=UPI002889A526|nr:SA1362 family protein [Cytobacillus sp. AMY 15.2]
MAFLKKPFTFYIVSGLIILAVIGVAVSLISNPAGFLQRIAVIVIIGAAVYFLFQRFNRYNPSKREQRAFIKAAKKSKRRFNNNKESGTANGRKGSVGSITSIKKSRKKSSPHLTVIEGKKGKKKNRASL